MPPPYPASGSQRPPSTWGPKKPAQDRSVPGEAKSSAGGPSPRPGTRPYAPPRSAPCPAQSTRLQAIATPRPRPTPPLCAEASPRAKPHPELAEPMAPTTRRWAPVLWRACNWLMAAFFALAALVQVSAPAPGGRRWEAGEGLRGLCRTGD